MQAMAPRRLAAHQIQEAGETLGRAFFDDPFFVYALPAPATRRRTMAAWCAALVRYGYLFGEVYTTPGPVRGVAIWLPPGAAHITPLRALRAGWVWIPLRLGIAGMGRVFWAAHSLSDVYRRTALARHWHLSWLGVDPLHQRQGIGSALLQPGLARADAERLPCSLATFNAANVPFYQHHGFQVVAAGPGSRGRLPLWIMQREPVGAPA